MWKYIALISFLYYAPASLTGQIVNVSTSTQLQNALNAALPGQTIVLANGVYTRSGGFSVAAGINGTSAQPIRVQGNANTIISSNNLNTGYGFALNGNTYWILEGFTVYNSKKGIVLDDSHHNLITNIKVNKMGDEGIHLRTYSSFNTVDGCFVDSCGLVSTGTGEGIYIGSANSNWGTYTGGNPDTCNYNTVSNNSFGDHIASENVDIKEGTTGGYIYHNTFNGAGLNGVNSADSWVDVKGNYYTVECNSGSNTILDGIQSHITYTGYGNFNSFANNTFTVGSGGHAISIQTTGSNGTAPNNIVCTNNTVSGGGLLTNVSTQSCATSSCSSLPLIWLSFTASKIGAGVGLEWNTAEERDCHHFVIKSSPDGIRWDSIGYRKAQNTTTLHHYVFLDSLPYLDMTYYRLTQVDLDGHLSYSPITSISIKEYTGDVVVQPVPAHDYLQLFTTDHIDIISYSIYSISGELIFSPVQSGYATSSIEVSGLANGIYILKSLDAHYRMRWAKFIILHP